MHEIPKQEEATHALKLDQSVYLFSSFRKAAEYKMNSKYLQRSTISLKLNEILLYDDPFFPVFREPHKTMFFSID